MLKLEDAQDFTGSSTDKAAQEATHRAERISMNDLETIPIGMIMSWGAFTALSINTPGGNLTQVILMIIFTIGRIGHTVSYSKGLQPWRSIFYLFSLLCNFGFAINGIVAVLGITTPAQ